MVYYIPLTLFLNIDNIEHLCKDWSVDEWDYTDILILNVLSEDDIVVAQYDFKPSAETDLPFKKGEKLKVLCA